MLEAGQRIGRYAVVGLIGHGGLASVYRVRHVDLGSSHALKLLDVHHPQIRDRLLDEGRAQATLVHPNVVRVTDVLVHEDLPVLILELIDGPALDCFLADRPLPDLATTLALAAGIARGLRAAHLRGLVHRDLKPGNVLLARTPDGLLPKLADFGLVKVLAEEGRALRTPTRVGTAMGTPAYMAPEQFENAAGVDARADLYSLGVVLYLMLTGSVPVPGTDFVQTYDRLVAADWPRPSEVIPGLPPALDRLVVRLLSLDPAGRPASCDEVLEVLESVAARIPTGPSTIHPADLLDAAADAGSAWDEVVGAEIAPRMPKARSRIALAAPLALPVALAAAGLAARADPPPPPPPPAIAAPAVVAPAPEPEPAAVPRPAPAIAAPVEVAPARPRRIRVDVEGDATRVWLVRDDRRRDLPGSVPPGTYDVVALFPGSAPVPAGRVVVDSEPITLRCVAFALRCRP